MNIQEIENLQERFMTEQTKLCVEMRSTDDGAKKKALKAEYNAKDKLIMALLKYKVFLCTRD
jgi:hypothetical protein